MALRRKKRDPQGRMPLLDHLRELRNRFLVCVVAIVIAAVPGWMSYDLVLLKLTEPLIRGGGSLNFGDLTAPFAVHMQVALFVAVILASPVWVYELWAFIVPGLTRREKYTALAFLGSAVPLFVGGCAVAYVTLDKAVQILLAFMPQALVEAAPQGTNNLISAAVYLTFVMKFIAAFGVAFLLPVFLVGLNLAHVLPARVMIRGWRVAVLLIFVFAAVMTPTPDPWTMCIFAFPMIGLYFLACGIAAVIDRRRAKAVPEWASLPDDQASPL